MNWICIGLIAGSLITSLHDTEEQCRGREAMLNKIKEASVKCVAMPNRLIGSSSGTVLQWVQPNTYTQP